MLGYFRNPEATGAGDADGWLKTGDLGRQDDDGYLFMVGRSKELIIRSGFNVYPPEVEAVLNAHPQVTLSAVVGRPVKGDEEVVAFVQPAEGARLTAEAFSAYAPEHLSGYKRPRKSSSSTPCQRVPPVRSSKANSRKLPAPAPATPETAPHPRPLSPLGRGEAMSANRQHR